MTKIKPIERVLLLGASLLAAYQVAVAIEGLGTLALVSYTVAFGVLLLAVLLIMILGFDILDSPLVAIVSTIIPLSLSLGLVAEYLPDWSSAYLVFVVVGFILVAITRFVLPGLVATLTLTFVHGVAGLLIFILPLVLSLGGHAAPGLALVGVGGGLIGVGGLLLSFLKAGKPILSRGLVLRLLPALLLLTTAAFVAGYAFR